MNIFERDMTPAELEREQAGFDQHSRDKGVEIQSAQRFGYVAMDGEQFIGCASGLAYKNGEAFSGWFYLTDLFVEKEYRRQGIGARLLAALEERVRREGVRWIYTWTAGYEGPKFYLAQGYRVFAELENWYSTGHSQVALRKELEEESADDADVRR